ncbi:MAG: TetR family transcriptional regulator [Alphaproteobacteria bacterium]|nr:TetR family transcriptional regulator [Alphaproteobacteria bacterium]
MRSQTRRTKAGVRTYGMETRELIMSAARRLFADHGLAKVSMQDVADAADVSRATVFNQFGSKQSIVDAIAADSLKNYRSMLDDALADEFTPTLGLLRQLFDRMAKGLEANRKLYRHLFVEIRKTSLGLDGGMSSDLRRETFDRLVLLFARGQSRGDVTGALPPEVMATAFDSLLSGAVTQWLQSSPRTSLSRMLAALAEVFLVGVAGKA